MPLLQSEAFIREKVGDGLQKSSSWYSKPSLDSKPTKHSPNSMTRCSVRKMADNEYMQSRQNFTFSALGLLSIVPVFKEPQNSGKVHNKAASVFPPETYVSWPSGQWATCRSPAIIAIIIGTAAVNVRDMSTFR